MNSIRLSLLAGVLLIVVACSDKGEDAPPAPPEKKYILKKIVTDNIGTRNYQLFEYDASDKLIKIVSDSFGKPGHTDIEFFYDGQGRLSATKDYGNAFGPGAFQENRKYYYDAVGNCVGDSGFNEQMFHTYHRDNAYTYDAQGRLHTIVHGNGTFIRYEYGTGKNPIKQHIKYVGNAELPILDYTVFDNKKNWLGNDKVLKQYFRSHGYKYNEEFFENNPIKYREAFAIRINDVLEYADIEEEIQYNTGNYPVKRRIIQTTTAGRSIVMEQEFEYIEE